MATIRKFRDKWQVQVRRKGHRPLTRSFINRQDAVIWARQTEVLIDRFELPTEIDPRILEETTLGDLVRKYRAEVSPTKRGGKTEQIILTAFLRHPICRKTLHELKPKHFADYRDQRLKTIKPSTLRRQLAPIHNLFELATKEWGLPIKTNPLDYIRLDKSDVRRERRLRDGEWDRILAAAERRRNPFLVPIIRLALETGMRRGEILAMKWDHLDRSDSCLLIPHTKNGYSRSIPLTSEAWAILDGVPRQEALVFPISANAFRLAWERLKKQAGIDDLRFHDLRHEAISRFFEAGLSVPEVALISGHRDARMLLRYTHPLKTQVLAKLAPNSPRQGSSTTF